MLNYRDLERELPPIHRNSDGQAVSWYVTEVLADYIAKNVRPGMRTLETGAGLSTILFAQAGSQHTSVVYDPSEVDRIKNFCQERKIPTSQLQFLVGMSELVLPQSCPQELDFVLIDGCHGFPTPFIDWYYTQRNLKVGGIMAVDDTQIWTGGTLKRFLSSEPGWERLDQWPYRAAVFRKTAPSADYLDWYYQPFVHGRSITHARVNDYLAKGACYFLRVAERLPKRRQFFFRNRKKNSNSSAGPG